MLATDGRPVPFRRLKLAFDLGPMAGHAVVIKLDAGGAFKPAPVIDLGRIEHVYRLQNYGQFCTAAGCYEMRYRWVRLDSGVSATKGG